MQKITISLLVSAVASAANLKVGVFSDNHMNMFYNAYQSGGHCLDAGSDGSPVAPLARYDCDGNADLLDFMFTRHREVFGDMDFILVPGDFAAHKLAERVPDEDPSGTKYQEVKENIAAVTQKLTVHFPFTVMLPTFGNNDGRVHDQAIDEADKTDYYSYVYNSWFVQHPGNANLDLGTIHETVMAAGYYRADPTPDITVLSINSMYMYADDLSTHAGEDQTEDAWFEYQLSLARLEGRKVIIIDHVYAGTRHNGEKLWDDAPNQRYFNVLRDYADIVIIEVVGHDHLSDLRYHSSYNVADLPDTDTKFDFHNMLVAPGITPWEGSNPGMVKFEITDNFVPTLLEMEFLNIEKTFGMETVTASDLEWWHMDWASQWGLTDIDATSISEFRKFLEADEPTCVDYLVSKLGFDYNDSAQYTRGVNVLTDVDLITTTAHHTYEYICQMHKSITPQEYLDCVAANKSSGVFLE